eukprot:3232907-Rhodomonas_salina.1
MCIRDSLPPSLPPPLHSMEDIKQVWPLSPYAMSGTDIAYAALSLRDVRIGGVVLSTGILVPGSVTPEEYLAAKPDPLHLFAQPVMKHMNDVTAPLSRLSLACVCSLSLSLALY